MYALPAWGLLLNVELVHKTDGFLKSTFRYGFARKLITIQRLLDSATEDLFCKVKSSNHRLHPLLPPDRTLNQVLRARGHSFQLPACSFNLHISCYGRPLSVSGRPCYILPMFFFIFIYIYIFYGRLILRPWLTEVRESFTHGGP